MKNRYFLKRELALWGGSVLVILLTFFFNDLYGFISWRKMQKRQAN